MREPLTLELMGEMLARLRAAFPRSTKDPAPATTVEVYRNGLRGLSGTAIRAAVDRVIQEDEYFPKVARLRDLAHAWMRVNEARPEAQVDVDPRWCPNCQTQRRIDIGYRAVVDERHRVQLSRCGKYLLLETITRDVCDCSSRSLYMPDETVQPLAMHVTDVVAIPEWKALAARHAIVRSGIEVTRNASATPALSAILVIGPMFAHGGTPKPTSLSHAVSDTIALLILAGAVIVLAARWRLARQIASRRARYAVRQ